MGCNAIYDYTPTQLRVVELHDHYRTALMNAKYYARRLEWYKAINTWADVVVALATSSGFAGLAIWKNPIGANFSSALLAASALVAALRPIFRLSDRIDRYGKLQYGYLELYYRIDALISEMRSMDHVTEEHRQKASELAERFRALELEGDAYQNPQKLLSIQDEVEQALPAAQLWLPRE